MNDFERAAIATALKKMFRADGYMDICTLDKCLRIANIIPNSRDYNALSAMHCVKWRDMTKELQNEVGRRVLSMFEHETGFDLDSIDRVIAFFEEDQRAKRRFGIPLLQQ
jgi:hypothetical protein